MNLYVPPFDTTNEIFEISTEIMENIGKLSSVNELDQFPRLRKVSRVKSIQSTLAIENNTLSLEQVTAIVDGKKVLGPADEILEVQNAIEAYKQLDNINPYNLNDLLRVHGIMMSGIIAESGKFRQGNVGIFKDDEIIYTAPPAHMVGDLINQLFEWINNSNTHILIKSSVFHYEFEFIHPFRDGNGRMGRLWQTALLSNWKSIFKYIPIESVIKDNQEAYYNAIITSTNEGKSNKFIIFMLQMINKAIKDILLDSKEHYNHINLQINKLMRVMDSYPQSAQMIMDRLGLKSRNAFRKNYLNPALEMGLIGMTIPNKPTSKNQMYFKK